MTRTYHPRGEFVDGYRVCEHPLYTTWAGMLARCCNRNSPAYNNYGARGIAVCDRWHHFRHFASDMGMKPTTAHTLERRDNSRGYSPDNCIWATCSDQCINRRQFKNNTTGVTGVNRNGICFYAQFDYEQVRYSIGTFYTSDAAVAARERFVKLFFTDRDAALKLIEGETIWGTSSTNVRGVTPHLDGGSIARCTVQGERIYLGYYKTIEEANHARQKRLAQAT